MDELHEDGGLDGAAEGAHGAVAYKFVIEKGKKEHVYYGSAMERDGVDALRSEQIASDLAEIKEHHGSIAVTLQCDIAPLPRHPSIETPKTRAICARHVSGAPHRILY